MLPFWGHYVHNIIITKDIAFDLDIFAQSRYQTLHSTNPVILLGELIGTLTMNWLVHCHLFPRSNVTCNKKEHPAMHLIQFVMKRHTYKVPVNNQCSSLPATHPRPTVRWCFQSQSLHMLQLLFDMNVGHWGLIWSRPCLFLESGKSTERWEKNLPLSSYPEQYYIFCKRHGRGLCLLHGRAVYHPLRHFWPSPQDIDSYWPIMCRSLVRIKEMSLAPIESVPQSFWISLLWQ